MRGGVERMTEANEDPFFFRITPDRVLAAVEAEGFETTGHCTALNALENRVYDVRLEGGEAVVIKFYRPGRWSRETILDEHRMLFALRDAEIPVCAPLVFEDGESLHSCDDIFYALWPRIGGRSPDELQAGEIEVLGRLLARIHDVGAALELQHRPTLSPESLPLSALSLLEERGFLPASVSSHYCELVHELVEIYRARVDGIEHLPIHGDCHCGNILRTDAGWTFLDFDDLVIGPAVHDVWMLLPGRDAHARAQRERLVQAYEAFRPFPRASLELIEPLRAFRFVFYAGWIAKRWEDPAFPDAFPHFGSEAYWQGETRDLEGQLELIRSGRDVVSAPETERAKAPSGDETELRNEDFFWDL